MCNPLPGADLHELPPGRMSWRPVLPLERQITISLSASDTSATRRWQQTILRAKGQRKANYSSFLIFFFFFFEEAAMEWPGSQRAKKETLNRRCLPCRSGPHLSASPVGGRPAPAHRAQKWTVRHSHRALITQNGDTSTDMHVDGGAQSQVRTGRTETTTRSVWHS